MNSEAARPGAAFILNELACTGLRQRCGRENGVFSLRILVHYQTKSGPPVKDAIFAAGRCRGQAASVHEQRSGQGRATLRYFLAALSAYFFWKRSTRPAVSSSFCFPVKNGWQLEQISTRIRLPLKVERVSNVLPHAQWTVTLW